MQRISEGRIFAQERGQVGQIARIADPGEGDRGLSLSVSAFNHFLEQIARIIRVDRAKDYREHLLRLRVAAVKNGRRGFQNGGA